MTEIGLAASIFAAFEMAREAGKFAILLSRLIRDARWASNDIKNIEVQLRLYESSLTATRLALDSACEDFSSSEVIRFLEAVKFHELLDESSEPIGKRIREARDRLPDLRRESRVSAGFKWFIWSTFRKEELMELYPHLEGVKSWLNIIVTAIQTTMYSKERQTPQLKRKM